MAMGYLYLPFLLFVFGCAAVEKKSEVTSEANVTSVISFQLHDNRMLIPVMINGKGPFTFVFDTGGGRTNTITPEAAKKLELVLVEGIPVKGAGSNRALSWKTKVDQYLVGNLVLKDQSFTVIDLSSIKKAFNFQNLDGIIGLDVLKKAVACIDFDKQILKLSSGEINCFDTKGVVLPFELDGRTPAIAGSISGIPGKIVIDTGDRSAFSIFQKFSLKNNIENKFVDKPLVVTGVGVGGVIRAKLAVLAEIKLGDEITLNKVLSRRPYTIGNYFATSTAAGSIGNEVLRRFNLILDYNKYEITFIKNSHFSEPYTFVPPKLD